jgi:hypothetical protein
MSTSRAPRARRVTSVCEMCALGLETPRAATTTGSERAFTRSMSFARDDDDDDDDSVDDDANDNMSARLVSRCAREPRVSSVKFSFLFAFRSSRADKLRRIATQSSYVSLPTKKKKGSSVTETTSSFLFCVCACVCVFVFFFAGFFRVYENVLMTSMTLLIRGGVKISK